ncbi:MAG: hypothetical protein IPN59_09335 [Holophaga sp.]|nr:hypothetical protein [Holophaga sp.]
MVERLRNEGIAVAYTGLAPAPYLETLEAEWLALPNLSEITDWAPFLQGITGVVHLAGIAHQFDPRVASDWDLFDRVNHLPHCPAGPGRCPLSRSEPLYIY